MYTLSMHNMYIYICIYIYIYIYVYTHSIMSYHIMRLLLLLTLSIVDLANRRCYSSEREPVSARLVPSGIYIYIYIYTHMVLRDIHLSLSLSIRMSNLQLLSHMCVLKYTLFQKRLSDVKIRIRWLNNPFKHVLEVSTTSWPAAYR